ncbi:MAG TPA: UDP-N-acetylglucosamine 2-epimerase (non-hydrolyzing) [Candidatus Acidoferrales bacterium]|nr:UDP-N-acetylglucosamine 2-epimerase (non-hydrolyzing) [Candidatus Acidoferrales bacterium]
MSLVIRLLDKQCDHVLVSTGQNYDDRLSGLFFRELEVRRPDVSLGVCAPRFPEQLGKILSGVDRVLRDHQPDRVLILGDTNSGLSAIIARRYEVPVYHMEAGNRCYDFRVPEEANRRIIDHLSSVLMPYTSRSRENLLREGFAASDIYVTGNPIYEVLRHFERQVASSEILSRLNVSERKFFLVTMHRAENVDVEERLRGVFDALALLYERYRLPIICSVHPRTRSMAAQFRIAWDRPGIVSCEPFGFFDFIRLQQSALCVISDSGTVQEEACIMRVPNVTIRDVTERPETVECGSNVLAGCHTSTIVQMVDWVTSKTPNWQIPSEYLVPEVANAVAGIVLSRRWPA